MSATPGLLIVWHSRSGAAQAMASAAAQGAREVAAWAAAELADAADGPAAGASAAYRPADLARDRRAAQVADQGAAQVADQGAAQVAAQGTDQGTDQGADQEADQEADRKADQEPDQEADREAEDKAEAAPGARTGTARQDADVLRVILIPAGAVQADDLLHSDGYLFCGPENLGSLSGAMKEFFDRCYYGVLDAEGVSPIAGRPYGLIVSAGTDGSGAARQAERICTGWRLRQAAPPLIARNGAQTPAQILAPKTVASDVLDKCKALGGMLAGLLLMGR